MFIVLGSHFQVNTTDCLFTNIDILKLKVMLNIYLTIFPLNVIVFEDKLIITLWRMGEK